MLKKQVSAIGLVAVALVLLVHGLALAHAELRSSDPAAGSVLASPPSRIRLVFSERLEIALSSISLVAPNGERLALSGQRDSTDDKALVAAVSGLGAGKYRVLWRAVAADGHASSGSYEFDVAASTMQPPVSTPPATPPSAAGPKSAADTTSMVTFAIGGAPLIASIVRGVGITSLMIATGMLLFAALGHAEEARRPRHVIGWLLLVAAVGLSAHLFVWLMHLAPQHQLSMSWIQAAMRTVPAQLELARTVLAILTLLAFVLARRIGTALLLGTFAVAVSGAVGHAAAIDPVLAIPSKAIHLLAASVWGGGLAWLISRERENVEMYAREAGRVSSLALTAAIVVVLSAIAQAMLFLDRPSDLLHTPYGIVVLLKSLGFLILIGFGAYHRSQVSDLRGSLAAEALRATVRYEMVVLVVVALLGALLAYMPPRPAPPAPQTSGLFPHWIQR